MTKNIWPVMPIMMLGSSIGAIVGGILYVLFKKHEYEKNGNKVIA